MPLSKHYKGKGEEVAESMKRRYGGRWKQVFYATENAQKKRKKRKRKTKR